MLDIIARMLISSGIFIGTTYLPALSEAVSTPSHRAEASAGPVRDCAVRQAPASGARATACIGWADGIHLSMSPLSMILLVGCNMLCAVVLPLLMWARRADSRSRHRTLGDGAWRPAVARPPRLD